MQRSDRGMDSSPLIKAHDHARAASIATHSADSTVAINEHTLAAGEFSNAAKSTTSSEALRTLALLEQHHRRLSELLKHPFEPSSQQSSADGDIPEEDETESQPSQEGEPKAPKPAVSHPPTIKPLPTLANPRRYPSRELSSSIASNLASARGIRSSKYRGQALTPSLSNDLAPGNLEVHPRRNKGQEAAPDQPSWVPPTKQAKQEPTKPSEPPKREQPARNASEEGFSRFYSTFGSLINRLSAPLAFAGLPLIAEETKADQSPERSPELIAPKRRPQRTSSTNTAEPDLSKIYSRATLRSFPGAHGTADSFYVVPTSGHTASYASILNHESKEKRRLAASIHHDLSDLGEDDQDEDDFVDARESQQPSRPLSPSMRKRLGKSKSEKDLQNVIEELHLENASLKEMLDKLSKRLHVFELNSQSSHLALAQSIRMQRPGSPMSSSGGGGEESLKKKNQELEQQLGAVTSRMLALERDHQKLQQTVEKYRDRWEKLKAGAKARRENAAAQQDQGGGS